MKILFIGSSTLLSILPLSKLIESNATVCAIASDEISSINTLSNISIINNDNKSIGDIACSNNIPYITLSKNILDNIENFKNLEIDLLIVSCYARKLPTDILELARIGSFNLHPSLLPEFRGPSPLFWQFRAGIKKLSVTLHRMTGEFDDGNIIKQKSKNKQDGLHSTEVNEQVAELATEVLFESLPVLIKKNFQEIPQLQTLASYQSHPGVKDYFLSIKWTAQHMYNFICANMTRQQSFPCQIKGITLHISRAFSFNMKASLSQDYEITGNQITLNCAIGIIECQLAVDLL